MKMLNLRLLANDFRRVKYKMCINTPFLLLSLFLHNKYYRNISERYMYGF